MNNTIENAMLLLGSDPHLIRACLERRVNGIIIRDVAAHLRASDVLPASFQEVVVADVSDIGEVWAGLGRLLGTDFDGRPLGVATSNEFAICAAADLAERFALPGARLTIATRMRDKQLQKQAVREAGIPVAGSRVVVAGSGTLSASFTDPCVVKPLAGAASVHTYSVQDEAAYEALLERLATLVSTPLIVEDFIPAIEEWLVDGVMQNGIPAFMSVGRYGQPAIAYGRNMGGDPYKVYRIYRMDGTGADDRCAQARSLAHAALAALGYEDGVFHMELLLDPSTDTLCFSECAARRGGAMFEEEVATKHGFSLAGAAVDVALGRPVSTEQYAGSSHVGTTYLYLPRGTIVRLPDPKQFVAATGVDALYISALLGHHEPPAVRNTSYQQAMCVVSGESAADLQTKMAQAQIEFERQSLVAPTFATKAVQRAFMARYDDEWRKLL